MDNEWAHLTGEFDVTLIRHGQTEWSKSGRHTGRTDIPLTELGRRQAAALGTMLSATDFSLVVSSPLSRAWETMTLAGFAEVAVASDDLLEWDYGEYESRSTAEIREDTPEWTVWTHPIGGGESIEQVAQRADRVIATAINSDGPVALFAHAHILRVLAARWMGLSPTVGSAISLDTATLSTLGWERDTRVIRTWNLVCPLPSEDPVL